MEALPRDLVLSIDQVLGPSAAEQDFDLPTFNLENALNEVFPDEDALEKADTVTERLDAEIGQCRRSIQAAEQETASSDDLERLSQLQGTLGELFTEVHHLQTGASESQSVVKDITRDIKTLDTAKSNITTSMTAIKRFQMLANGFDQLSRLAKAKKYRETAQSLLATKELQAFFKSYTAVERVNTLFTGTNRIRSILRDDIMRDFESALGPSGSLSSTSHAQDREAKASRTQRSLLLMDACQVVDALGDDTKQTLLEWYTNTQLRDYRRIFRPSDEAGQLDNTSRRYAFFKRILQHVSEEVHGSVFPESWNVPAVLAASMATQTRDDLKTVLSTSAHQLNVTLLLEAISATQTFERDMSKRFHMPFEAILALSPSRNRTDPSPSSIYSIFEPYLGIFVDSQDRAISEMVLGYRNQPRKSIDASSANENSEENNTILPSSAELFYYYRETLERCAALTTKAPFLGLCDVFKRWLRTYAEDVLGRSLVRPNALAVSTQSRRSSADSRLSMPDLTNACIVLNTADYCAETSGQLEERLIERAHPDFKERITFEGEKEIFLGIISTALTTVLKELELSIEPTFHEMTSISWRESDMERVSAESGYVSSLRRNVDVVVDVVRDKVDQRKYFRSFCDRVVSLVLGKFLQSLVRCRPISPMGAEQLLLDLSGIKTWLLKLPQALSSTNATYTRFVSKGVGRIETLLKVIMAQDSPADEFVSNYLVLIPCQSFSDFQKILDLKGVRKGDQNELQDAFLASTSEKSDLSDASILTGLDMDPNLSASLIASPQPAQNSLSPSSSAALSGGQGILAAASVFSGLPMWNSGAGVASRDASAPGSRMGTPQPPSLGRSVSFADQESPSPGGQQQQPGKFGAKLGRFFGRDGRQ